MPGRGESEPIRLLAEFICDTGGETDAPAGRGASDGLASVVEFVVELEPPPTLRPVVEQALAQLPTEDQALVRWHAVDHLSFAEIEQRLDVPRAVLHERFARCVARLKETDRHGLWGGLLEWTGIQRTANGNGPRITFAVTRTTRR